MAESIAQFVADIVSITGPNGRSQRRRYLADQVPNHLRTQVQEEVVRYFERRRKAREGTHAHTPAF